MIFRRDPALWLSLLATAIRLAVGFGLPLTVDQQSLLNAVLAAVVGLVVAFTVRHDGQVAAILGFVGAAIALAIGFGLRLSPENQALIMSFVGTVLAAFTRTQVGTGVPPVTKPELQPAIKPAQ